MALSVERVAVVGHGAIERLDREVQRCAVLDLAGVYLTQQLLLLVGVREVVLLLLEPMVHRDKEVVILREGAGDQGLPESGDWL